MSDLDDPQLRARFQALKEADARAAPSFQETCQPAPRWRARRLGWIALPVAVAGLLFASRPAMRPPAPRPAPAAGSLDFLLDLPGRTALSRLPPIGTDTSLFSSRKRSLR